MIEINRTNRINSRTISNEIGAVEQKYLTMSKDETKALREQRAALYKEELEFRQKASDFIRTLTVGDKLNIKTQVGPNGGEIIQNYSGSILQSVSVINSQVNTFNITHAYTHENKPFTIGLSCLLSIEKAE